MSISPAVRPTAARRLRAVLATAATAAVLALSLPLPAAAAVGASGSETRASGGPVRMAITDTQTIVVNVAAIRTAGGPQPLAGVVLELRNSSASSPDAPGTPVGQPWSTCTSIANGSCTFTVPNAGTGPGGTKGENNGKRFWVVQVSAPADYYLNPTLITGNNTNSGSERFAQTPYVYRTPALTGSGTITLPSMTGLPSQSTVGAPLNSTTAATEDRWITGGKLPVSQANNRFETTCTPGMTVAILFDLSSSMASSNNAGLNGAKTAGKALVDALVGTGAQVALYTFGTAAPKNNSSTGQNYPTLTTVTAASATTLKSNIDGYSASDATNYTNWDRGLWQLAQASGAFDIAIVLTDGNPTVYGSTVPSGGGGDVWTYNRHVEEAIFSANALKDEGTQIVAFGVGDGISQVSADNLRAVAGTSEWTGIGSITNYDYAKTNDWALVSSQLKALAAGLTCTIPITVTKTEQLLNGGTQLGQGWTFSATESGSGSLSGAPSQVTGANGQVSWSFDLTSPSDTGSVTIDEQLLNSGWQLSSVTCTNNGAPFYSGSSASFTLEGLSLGDNIACAVVNQQIQSSVVVTKTWVVNGVSYPDGTQPAGLAAQLDLGGAPQPWATPRDDISVGATTTIEESITSMPELCTVTGQELSGPGASAVDLSGGASFTTPALPAGLSTYDLTNTVICTSSLTLIKDVTNDDGGSADPTDWTLSYNGTGVASGTTVYVTPGEYALTESDLDGYAPRATDALLCTQGLTGTTVTIPLASAVTCTFYNDDIAPTLSLEKIVAGADGVDASNWTLTATEGSTTVLSGAGSVPATEVLANTAYTLAESPGAFPGASAFDAGRWECQTNGTGPWTTLGADGVLPGIDPGDAVHCRITNTLAGVEPEFDKTIDSLVQNADGTWTITYTVSVSNPGLYAALTYDLSDTLAFGGTITKTATATGPSGQAATWDGVANTVLADDAVLPADSTHEYVVVVIATVPDGASGSITNCPTGDGPGGFLNRAVLTVDGEEYPDSACAEPVTPTFSKSPGTATSNADGTWTLSYALSVTNGSSIPLHYDLVDDPQSTMSAGVTVVSGAISPAGAWNPLSNTVVADDAALPANTTHEYTVSIVVAVAPSVPEDQLECSVTGGGLVNAAMLTSGNQVLTDDACLEITAPTIIHDKTVTTTAQNADGTWTIVYDIVVKNTGAVPGLYDLSDELRVAVADTITVVSASADGVPSWNGTSDQVLATSRLIAPGEAGWQHYTITVVASVAPGMTGSPATLCEAVGGTNGFLNDSAITVAGVTTEDSACSDPTRPILTKTLVESAPSGANAWDVTYVITVDNSTVGAHDAYYTLTDVPGFSSELTITGYTVTETSAVPESAIEWNGGDLVPVPRLITGGSVDSFEVVVSVTVPAGIDEEVLECTEEEAPGHGFQNAASIVVGTDTLTAVDCGDAEESAVPTIAKTVADGSPKQLADGTWEVVYDITVTSESDLDALYSLTDELGFGAGISVLSSSIESADATPAPDWDGVSATTVVTDQVISGGDEHVYRVTVIASVDADAYDTGATACDPALTDDGGFLNTATLTSGKADPQSAADCASPAAPEVSKVVDPANPPVYQGEGNWLVTYLVTVTNPSDLQLAYDLDDTLAFPTGVDLSGQHAIGPDGQAIEGWDGVVDTALAEGASLPGGAEHVYTIAVLATPSDELDLDDVECAGSPGSGLVNSVELTSGDVVLDDAACADLDVALLTLVKQVDNSAFDGLDLGDAVLPGVSDWVLSADGPEVLVGESGTDAVTSVIVPAGEFELAEDTSLSSTNPLLDYYVASDWECSADGLDGSTLTLELGTDVTCTIVNTGDPVDLAIVKTDGGELEGEPAVPTTEDSSFEYTFVVTNNGDLPATDVVVTDEIPATLAVQVASIVLPDGWTADLAGADVGGFGGTLTLTLTGSEAFAAGAVAEFTIPVRTAASLPREGGDPAAAILDIENTATVESSGIEETPEDNSSTEFTPVKSLEVVLQVLCEADAPWVDWTVTPHHTDGVATSPVVLIWWTAEAYANRDPSIPAGDTAAILADGASHVDVLPMPAGGWLGGVSVSGSQLWPGAEIDLDTGDGIAWPGWIIGDEGEWVLDPSAPFFEVHESAVVEVRMNPSTASTEAYPPAELGCFPTDTPTLPEPPVPPVPPTVPLLANTGLNLLGGVVTGIALLGFGLAANKRRRPRH